ncbi:MAG TPA: energy transducer TonB [Burkholderiales bacterium]|nr:energy transducer TonB [Burkholderiales bacterium]
MLHLVIITSIGPVVTRPSAAWESPRRELTVTIVSKAPAATAFLKRAARVSEPARPEPISVPLPSAPRYFEAAEVDIPARVVNDVILRYPPSAFQQKISGEVKLRLWINQEGDVDEAAVIASEPEEIFDAAAMDAARQLHYSPAQKDGVPVGTIKTIIISFDPTSIPL